jgi:tetraacyldisaccharide 4'-kinase
MARALEDGLFAPLAPLAHLWGPLAARTIVRPLDVPDEILAVTVGGSTLGGSGKTTVAIACARALATPERRVALIGHAHRARPERARVVRPDDRVEEVGDEAILCARALPDVMVIVAPRKQDAVELAARHASAIVVDGPLRVRATRAIAVLAVDRDHPWSRGQVVPAGDLRARPADLLAAADHVVSVDASSFELPTLERTRVGLFTAVARPDRIARALAAKGVELAARIEAPDHGPAPPRSRFGAADLWIATPKCALHLEARGVPHVVLEPKVALPRELARALGVSALAVHATP